MAAKNDLVTKPFLKSYLRAELTRFGKRLKDEIKTVEFCRRCQSSNSSFPRLSSTRTEDQMIQASRSGASNIPEGNQQASLEGYIRKVREVGEVWEILKKTPTLPDSIEGMGTQTTRRPFLSVDLENFIVISRACYSLTLVIADFSLLRRAMNCATTSSLGSLSPKDADRF